jgi:hypothetical protein
MAKNTKNLKRIISIVERRYGLRVPGCKLRPVLIEGQNFPQTLVSDHDRTVTVRLTESTRKYPQQAIFQLAHEAVHCLSPAARLDTLGFEEGLANHHALTFLNCRKIIAGKQKMRFLRFSLNHLRRSDHSGQQISKLKRFG